MNERNLDKEYIFYLPAYQKNSNGIICVWEAAYYFSIYRKISIVISDNLVTPLPNRYINIDIYARGASNTDFYSYYKDLKEFEPSDEAIIVTPDDPHGYLKYLNISNNESRVVRYLMCRSLILSAELLEMSNNDYGLSYSNAVSTIFPSYLIINDNVLNINTLLGNVKKKNKIVIYYGKVRYGICFKNLKKLSKEFDEVEVIHRHYPENSKDLYNKIAESSLFVSIDPLTSLIHESTLIGTPAYVYDSCFKEFYDNFDFKLHGLYYNLKPSDLEKIYEDSKTLSSKAKNTALEFMSDIEDRTLRTIKDIESHFDKNLSNESKIDLAVNEDLEFFKKKWKIPIIFNCISFRTIYRYHLINNYKFFALIALFLNRVRIKILDTLFFNFINTEELVIIKKIFGKNFNIKKNSQKLEKQKTNKILKLW